ncbi:FtsK/SpoIIIE domain-containing protein [Micromonospora sp. WMMD987]|uniref:FtsK/SpoIIIE domain-containing protein n=1 Tax=Micromonospora sp. WMMD987 TaxID=3016089 RepID=UPI002499C230|nr:FtsK/SpoIIIE domain-containing protein [Micromonospora sp. WMMD987]WFE95147.1 FtsK/SpoIIIE domain-containing protein [Micromonospora sp. WMMD987]
MDSVAGPRARTNRAAALHRRAAASATAAAGVLDEIRPAPADQRRQYELADRLRSAAALLAPGWAGTDLESLAADALCGEETPPFVRIGTGAALENACFPALVPLLGSGHLTIDADVRDLRVAGVLRAVLLRLLAATPAGCLLVRAVDGTPVEFRTRGTGTTVEPRTRGTGTTVEPRTGGTGTTAEPHAHGTGILAEPDRPGTGLTTPPDSRGTGVTAEPDTADTGGTFAPFAALADAGLLPPPATDVTGLRAVLTEAEQWVSPGTGRPRRHDRTLLLVIAGLPESTGASDLDRIVALAERGRDAGLHLVVAGWPVAGRPPLPQATSVRLRTSYALLGDPPGSSFSGPGTDAPGGLNCPVLVDDDPGPELIGAVCRRLAAQVEAGSRLGLAELLPPDDAQLWTTTSVDGLSTTVGDAGGRPVTVGFTELTPHWLVSGRSDADRSAFLTNALLGLTARYGPDELALYLVDLGDGESFVEFLQTERDRSWLPQVRAAGMAADPEYVRDLFDQLTAEIHRREEAAARGGGQRFAELRDHQVLPRVVCVVDNFPLLLSDRDPVAAEVLARLDGLARSGRGYGVHLVLAGAGDLGVGAGPAPRDSVLGQFPVRVALAGGSPVLMPTNDAAAGLAVGSAVVNTAGGLGGPRGATRGHERLVRFPDPHDAPEVVERLRHRLFAARPEDAVPPVVFAGWARPLLRNDPRMRAAVAGRSGAPAALLGRAVDVARTTVAVPLGPVAGRNLAVLGPGRAAASLLATAARSTAAHHLPGTVEFVIAPLDEGSTPLAAALAAELAGCQRVSMVDGPGLPAVVDGAGPAYLVVFGVDAPSAAELPADRLRALLREGPAAGRHLLGWWRTVPPFAGLVEPDGEVGKLAAVAAVDVPGAQLAPVFGRPVQWRPRPDRVVLWDGPDDRGTVLVPFADEADQGRATVGEPEPGPQADPDPVARLQDRP